MRNMFQISNNSITNVAVQSDEFIALKDELWIEDDGVHGIGDIYDPETKKLSKPAPILIENL